MIIYYSCGIQCIGLEFLGVVVYCVCGIVLDGWYSGDELVDVGIVRG